MLQRPAPAPQASREDEPRAAKARNERKKAEKLKAAARALREKMHAKGVPGAAKPLSKIKGPSRADDADNISDSDDADDDAVPVGEEEWTAVPDYFLTRARARPRTLRGGPLSSASAGPTAAPAETFSASPPPGSGKTLAYLLPAVEFALRGARDRPRTNETPEGGRPRSSSRPRVSWRCAWRACAGSSEEPRPCVAWRCTAGRRRRTRRNSWRNARRAALLVVGTPGRITAALETDALGLERARMLVLDEADRMLALGFADQLEVIRKALPGNERDAGAGETGDGNGALAPGMGRRLGRQTLLFSATFPKTVRAVAKTWLAPKPAIVKIESADKSGDGKRSNEANVAVAAGGKGGDAPSVVSNDGTDGARLRGAQEGAQAAQTRHGLAQERRQVQIARVGVCESDQDGQLRRGDASPPRRKSGHPSPANSSRIDANKR